MFGLEDTNLWHTPGPLEPSGLSSELAERVSMTALFIFGGTEGNNSRPRVPTMNSPKRTTDSGLLTASLRSQRSGTGRYCCHPPALEAKESMIGSDLWPVAV